MFFKFKGIFVAIFSILAAGAMVDHAYAIGNNRIDLQISPATQRISLTPGASYTGTYKVMNIGYEKFDYKVYAAPYSVINNDYTPDFSKQTVYNKITEWITFDRTSGTLEPDGYDTITYTVKVPTDVPDGGQYASIMNETSENRTGSTVGTITRVGLTLYANMEGGKTRNCGRIIENKVPSFLFEPPISATSLIENCGNIDAEATYSLKVSPFFSDKAIYTNESAPERFVVLPETSRFNTIKWKESPLIGIFNVEQTIKAFGETSTIRQLVFIIPIWLIVIIIIFILSVIFWLVARARSRQDQRTAAKIHQD